MPREDLSKTELLRDEAETPVEEDLSRTQEVSTIDTIDENNKEAQRQIAEGLEKAASKEGVLEDVNIQVGDAKKKLEILEAQSLDEASYELLDADAKGAVEVVRQKTQDFLEAGNFKKESIAQLQNELGSPDWKDAIPDAQIRKQLGMLLSLEIKDQIRGKIKEEKLKKQQEKVDKPKAKKKEIGPDWRNPDAFPVPDEELPNLGEAREMTEEQAQEAAQQSGGNEAELPSSAIKGAESAQERFSERLENLKENVVDAAGTVKEALVQESRGEDRARRKAFINKQKSFWTRFGMRLGFISDQERIKEYEER